MHDDKLAQIEAELARQDEAFADFTRTLQSLGDVELAIPLTWLEEIETACAPKTKPAMPMVGIRG